MKYAAALFAALFLIVPLTVSAEVTDDSYLPTVILSEAGLWPEEEDLAWVELHNPSEEIISLEGWSLEFLQEQGIPLYGFLYPKQYGVFLLEESLEQSPSDLVLLNNDLEIIDQWNIEEVTESYPSLALAEEALLPTWLPTPGRPNLIKEKEAEPMCTEETPVPSQPTVPESPKQMLESGKIILSELYANPLGSETEEEFIELYNTESRTISLEGWIIADGAKSYTFREPVLIGPHLYKAFYRPTTGIALNNGAESVTLTDPFQREIDAYAYDSATEGVSWNAPAETGDWYEATPTPNQVNMVYVPATATEEEPENDGSAVIDEEEETAETTSAPDPNLAFIRLSEVMPNPAGSDDAEWVELVNTGETSIELTGLIVADASKGFTLKEGAIGAGEYLVLERSLTGIALNNTDETVELRLGDQVLDHFSYEISREGASWVFIDQTWILSDSPTPGEENTVVTAANVTQEDEAETSVVTTKKVLSTEKSSAKTSRLVSDWTSLKDGELVQVRGALIVPPGILQKRTAMIREGKNGELLELYFHQADWPELLLGQMLTVSGEVSETSKGLRLLIRDQADLLAEEITDLIAIPYEEAEDFVYSFLEGTIVKRLKGSITVSTAAGDIMVDYKAAGTDAPEAEEGDLLTASGIKIVNGTTSSLLIVSSDDVSIRTPEPEPVEPAPIVVEDMRVEKPSHELPLVWTALGGTITAAGFTGSRYLPLLQQLSKKAFDQIRDRIRL